VNIFQNIVSGLTIFIAVIAGLFHSSQILSIVQQTPETLNPLTIQAMRAGNYPGSKITIEQTLSPMPTYNRYIASYQSGGLKIYALLLVPKGIKPQDGWPVIILNHGYITPELYTPDYTVDDLNAITSIKIYPDSNPAKIGVWGHSMGGQITLKDVVINRTDIKAAVIWGGVVGLYNDIINNWQDRVSYQPTAEDMALRLQNLSNLEGIYGTPQTNSAFWNSVDPNSYLKDITAPLQIDVGLADIQVPPDFSTGLYNRMTAAGKVVEYYEYPGANHDINQSFTLAMKRTIDFFNRHLK
jgi:dienelactone hydrolase